MSRISNTRGPLQNSVVDVLLVMAALVFVLSQAIGIHRAANPTSNQNPPQSPLVKLSLNDATANELGLLPQIGPKMAARIIRFRSSHPTIRSWAEFESISGMGPSTIKTIQPWCAFVPVTEDLASNH